jgi:hypothetical protein
MVVRLAVIKLTATNADKDEGALVQYWWECNLHAIAIEISIDISQETFTRPTLYPANKIGHIAKGV